MGALLRMKLSPPIARKMLLEGHKWTSKEALSDGLVDEIAHPDKMFETALALGSRLAPKATAGVYGVLRGELYGEADRIFQSISHVHSRPTSRQAKANL
jgi:enoyl-CoA hydratase/carnithine racemase